MPTFTQDERARLAALLEAVRQIEQASIVAEGKSLSMQGSVRREGDVEESYMLFDSEAFRSLAISVRLVYMDGEPANFASICNILYKNGEEDLREAVAELRKTYNDLLNGSMVRLTLHGNFEGTTVGPREIFETWLYGGTFHQDTGRRAMYAELAKFGPRFTFGLHLIVTRIVQLILQLGYVVATALQEEERMHDARPPVT
jgi:hypothetical protein